MMRKGVRCWADEASCGNEKVSVFFTIPDFGDALQLFICPNCGEIFALDPETAGYSGKTFDEVTQNRTCPQCKATLQGLLPYPANFRCADGTISHYSRSARTIPRYEDSVIVYAWDILSPEK